MLHIAVNAEEVNVSFKATKACNAVGLMPKPATQIPTLNEEGEYLNWGIETVFSDFTVPTLEEETVMGQRAAGKQDNSNKLSTVQDEISGDGGDRQVEGSLGAKTNDNALFGAPADASKPDVDNTSSPRHTPLNEEGQEEPESRPKINNTAKHGVRSPSTRRPEVGQDAFEDPICDTFWQDIWVASAVYNVITFKPTSIINLAEFT
jgi:phospholipase D1/2